MRRTIPKPVDRDAWLAVRAPYVGASEAGILVGANPYETVSGLLRAKLDGSQKVDTDAMRRGRYLEAGIADWWADENDTILYEPEELYIYDEILVATLDRKVMWQRAAVEIKTTVRVVKEPKPSWYWQAQCQMLCADLAYVDLVVLDSSMKLKTFRIHPSRGDQVRLAYEARKFKRRREHPNEPAPVGRLMFASSRSRSVEASPAPQRRDRDPIEDVYPAAGVASEVGQRVAPSPAPDTGEGPRDPFWGLAHSTGTTTPALHSPLHGPWRSYVNSERLDP